MVLALDSINVRFGGIAALSGVSLEASAGEVLGIIGPNGAGKTTLFDVVSGMRVPNEGRVCLDGADVTSMSAVQRARKGMRRTFQRVQTFGWLTVEDNVLAALEWHGGGGGFLGDLVVFPTRRRHERSAAEHASTRYRAVRVRGGAQRARGLVADRRRAHGGVRARDGRHSKAPAPRRARVGSRRDEAARLGQLIQSVREETDCAMLLVEHNAGFVMEHSDRVVVLDLGSVLAERAPGGDPTQPGSPRRLPRRVRRPG